MHAHTEPVRDSGRAYERDNERVGVHKYLEALLLAGGGGDGSGARSEEEICSSPALLPEKHKSLLTLSQSY